MPRPSRYIFQAGKNTNVRFDKSCHNMQEPSIWDISAGVKQSIFQLLNFLFFFFFVFWCWILFLLYFIYKIIIAVIIITLKTETETTMVLTQTKTKSILFFGLQTFCLQNIPVYVGFHVALFIISPPILSSQKRPSMLFLLAYLHNESFYL